jgi:hypothetical protein
MHRGCGERHALGDAAVGVAARGQVEHRVEQGLKDHRRQRAIAGHEGQGGGQVATSTVAADGQARGVDVQRLGLRRQPAQRGSGVVQSRREGVFGREAVVHRNDTQASSVGNAPAQAVVAVQVANDPAAAMQEQQTGQRSLRVGALAAIDTHR